MHSVIIIVIEVRNMSDILSFQFSQIIGYGIIVIAILLFLVVILVSVINTVRILKQEANNNNMPVQKINVRVIGKRLKKYQPKTSKKSFRMKKWKGLGQDALTLITQSKKAQPKTQTFSFKTAKHAIMHI